MTADSNKLNSWQPVASSYVGLVVVDSNMLNSWQPIASSHVQLVITCSNMLNSWQPLATHVEDSKCSCVFLALFECELLEHLVYHSICSTLSGSCLFFYNFDIMLLNVLVHILTNSFREKLWQRDVVQKSLWYYFLCILEEGTFLLRRVRWFHAFCCWEVPLGYCLLWSV